MKQHHVIISVAWSSIGNHLIGLHPTSSVSPAPVLACDTARRRLTGVGALRRGNNAVSIGDFGTGCSARLRLARFRSEAVRLDRRLGQGLPDTCCGGGNDAPFERAVPAAGAGSLADRIWLTPAPDLASFNPVDAA